jgi:homocysteine S-methyltransferase
LRIVGHTVRSHSNLFETAIARNSPIVLDGGLATELEAQGFDIGTELWSAGLLQSNPEAIVAAHLAYLEAGAEIIISASYQASHMGFASLGLSERQAEDLIISAVELACTARQQFLDAHPETSFTPVVAASVGPYGAAIHDGSEYTGDYKVDEDMLRKFHEGRLRLLDQSGADVLACETIPNFSEARVLYDLLAHVELPAWVSFSCRDDRCISDGTSLQDVSKIFREHPRVLALGINCTAPHLIASLIGEIKQAAPDKAIVVYPNSGETYEVEDNSWHGNVSSVECADEANSWLSAGAIIVGGCCRVGPDHIAAIRNILWQSNGQDL